MSTYYVLSTTLSAKAGAGRPELPTPPVANTLRVLLLSSIPILCPLLCGADLGHCEPHFRFASCFLADSPVGVAKGRLQDGGRRVGISSCLCGPRKRHLNNTSSPQAHPDAAAESSLQFFRHSQLHQPPPTPTSCPRDPSPSWQEPLPQRSGHKPRGPCFLLRASSSEVRVPGSGSPSLKCLRFSDSSLFLCFPSPSSCHLHDT